MREVEVSLNGGLTWFDYPPELKLWAIFPTIASQEKNVKIRYKEEPGWLKEIIEDAKREHDELPQWMKDLVAQQEEQLPPKE